MHTIKISKAPKVFLCLSRFKMQTTIVSIHLSDNTLTHTSHLQSVAHMCELYQKHYSECAGSLICNEMISKRFTYQKNSVRISIHRCRTCKTVQFDNENQLWCAKIFTDTLKMKWIEYECVWKWFELQRKLRSIRLDSGLNQDKHYLYCAQQREKKKKRSIQMDWSTERPTDTTE